MTPSIVTWYPVARAKKQRCAVFADDLVARTRGAGTDQRHLAEHGAHRIDLVDQRFRDQHPRFACEERLTRERMDAPVLGTRQHARAPERDARLRDGSETPFAHPLHDLDKIRAVAPILVDHHTDAVPNLGNEPRRFVVGRTERLFAQRMHAVSCSEPHELGVRLARGHDVDRIQAFALQHVRR
jgi:hypothetical protein